MFHNYLAAALRNLVRNKLYAAINIIGLAVAFTAALLIALFVRDELSYDRFFPNHDRIYLLAQSVTLPGRAPAPSDSNPGEFAAMLKLDFPEIQEVARLLPTGPYVPIRRGEQFSIESLIWADPNIFEILKFPVVAGALDGALAHPNSTVITRRMARKYFGRDDPIGETLQINSDPMRITAVLEDLPSNTHIAGDFFAAGTASFSPLARLDANPPGPGAFGNNSQIYVKLSDSAAAQKIQKALPEFLKRHKSNLPGVDIALILRPLASIHLSPGTIGIQKPRGEIEAIIGIAAIGVLIVFAASINFVNLMTARASRRATEIGIRKVSGAERRQLVIQFLGESIIYVSLSVTLAVMLAALLLPNLANFLNPTTALDPSGFPNLNTPLDRVPVLDLFGLADSGAAVGRVIALNLTSQIGSFAFIVMLSISVGILGGIYPAFVIASFRPAATLKVGAFQNHGSSIVRQALVVLQFSVLIGLLIATGVTYRQTQYALAEAKRLSTDNVVILLPPCRSAFADTVRTMAGVRNMTCSSYAALGLGDNIGAATANDGASIVMSVQPVGFGFFEFYGLEPRAGRLFSEAHVGDEASPDPNLPMRAPVILNEAAARVLGFSPPQAAIGQTTTLTGPRKLAERSEIIGVVPDFSLDAIHKPVPPIAYFAENNPQGVISVRLEAANAQATLGALDKIVEEMGRSGTRVSRFFLNQMIAGRYADITRQGQLFSAFVGVAVFLTLLGLFGMSASVSDRRTKEIGIRKAMGANRADILRLLLWQLTKPVLWANAIAWPAAYFIMQRWLEGFAYHIDLEAWMFVAASALATLIAVSTVSGHALLVARAQPVSALRYE